MEETRDYPYGRTRQDTVAQPFTSLPMARKFASIVQRLTRERHLIVSRGDSWHLVLRETAEGKQVRA